MTEINEVFWLPIRPRFLSESWMFGCSCIRSKVEIDQLGGREPRGDDGKFSLHHLKVPLITACQVARGFLILWENNFRWLIARWTLCDCVCWCLMYLFCNMEFCPLHLIFALLFQIYKSSKCNDMVQTGYCPRGPFCAFAHVEREFSTFVIFACPNFAIPPVVLLYQNNLLCVSLWQQRRWPRRETWWLSVTIPWLHLSPMPCHHLPSKRKGTMAEVKRLRQTTTTRRKGTYSKMSSHRVALVNRQM